MVWHIDTLQNISYQHMIHISNLFSWSFRISFIERESNFHYCQRCIFLYFIYKITCWYLVHNKNVLQYSNQHSLSADMLTVRQVCCFHVKAAIQTVDLSVLMIMGLLSHSHVVFSQKADKGRELSFVAISYSFRYLIDNIPHIGMSIFSIKQKTCFTFKKCYFILPGKIVNIF